MSFNYEYGIEKLPKTLKSSEMEEYFIKFKNGDLNAREKLISHNVRLVVYIVSKKFDTVNYDKKELVSIGNIGLIKAVDTFDIEKDVKFATYATRCITNQILMFLRKLSSEKEERSLEDLLVNDNGDKDITILDRLKDDKVRFVEETEEKEEYKILRKIIEDLDDRDKEIVKMFYGFNNSKCYTQKEISDMLELSQSYISRLVIKINENIREKYELYEMYGDDFKIAEEVFKTNSIYEFFNNYDKDNIDYILTMLSEEDIELLKLRYGDDYNHPVSVIDFDRENFENLYYLLNSKMRIMLQDTKMTIYMYFCNYSKEEVDLVLEKLSNANKEIIRLRFGEDLENPVKSEDFDNEKYRIFSCRVLPKIGKMLEENKNKIIIKDNIGLKTIYEYFSNYEKDKVDEALKKLSDNEQKILKSRFGKDYIHPVKVKEIDPKYARRLNYILQYIMVNILVGKENKEKTIYEYFIDYTKEEINLAIDKLSEEDKKILKLRFGEDYLNLIKFSSNEKKVINGFYNKVLPKMNKLLDGKNIKNGEFLFFKKIKPLYDYLSEYTMEEIDEEVERLSYDDKNTLNTIYINGYEKIERIYIFYDAWEQFNTLIRKIEKNLCEKPNYTLLYSKEKVRDGKKAMSIYEILNMYSEEDIDYAIERLSFADKEIIRLKYDTLGRGLNNAGLNRFVRTTIPRIEKIIYNKYVDDQERKNNIDVRNIYNAFNWFTKEEIDEVLESLSDSDKKLLKLRYGDDLENPVTSCDFDANASNKFYKTLIPKIRRLLMMKRNGITEEGINDNKEKVVLEKKNPNSRKIKAIYDYFPEYKKEQIDLVLDKLPEEDIKILKIRYGEDIRDSYSSGEKNSVNDRIFVHTLIPKIKKFLDDKNRLENYTGDLRNSRDFKSIYDLLSDYSKEEINIVIEGLSDKYKEVINLRYGDNLEKPVTSKDWNKKSRSKFYYTVIPKIKKKLIENRENNNVVEDYVDNSLIDNEDTDVTDIILDKEESEKVDINLDNIDESETLDTEKSKNMENNVSIDEYIKLSEFIKRFNVFDNLSKEMVVISLKFGFIENKYYSNEAIANFLGISEEEVIDIIKNSLELYKEKINNLFDVFSDVLLDDKGFERKIK